MRVYQRAEINVSTKLTVMDCGECGVLFGITVEMEDRRREDGKTFWCPNGHARCYTRTEADRLREQLQNAEEQAALARTEQVRLQALARALADDKKRLANDLMDAAKERKRLEKRAAAGVCSKCNRTFQNVSRHMQSKHEHAVESAR